MESKTYKLLLLLAFCLTPLFVSAQTNDEGGSAYPPARPEIIRNSPLSPAEPSPGEAPPAETPQRSDVGDSSGAEGLVKEGFTALAKWDMKTADSVADKIEADGIDDEAAKFFLYRLAFFHGDYAKALEIMETLDAGKLGFSHQRTMERIRKLAKVMEGALEFESDHFIVRVTPGKDEILVKNAIRTMEKAYGVLTADMRVEPTGKVLLEFFPSFQAFNWATGLSEKDVETSGTVAVCKYSRMMVTTPRALLRGYSWRDTIVHEFVHYLVFIRSGYSVPIWLHEGIAKYEERRWRMDEGGYLNPVSRSLLKYAIENDQMITFEQMEPTFAKLPSPAHGALAFAEVSMAVKYLVHLGGFDLVLKIVDGLKKNPDYKKVIAKEMGEPYNVFHRKWVAYMKKLPLKRIEGMENIKFIGIKLKKGEGDKDDLEGAYEDDKQSPVYRHTRLGDLLREQERYHAALIEYEKALENGPNLPSLLAKTAHMNILVGEPDNAIPLLEKADMLRPDVFPSIYKSLGLVYMNKKDWPMAREYLEQSASINPFDPEVQKMLAQVYFQLGEKELEEEARDNMVILSRKPAR